MKIHNSFYRVLALTSALTTSVFAGGPYPIDWANDGSVGSGEIAPFYADALGLAPLSAGTSSPGDGCLLELIALQGGTNYLLATASIGDAVINFNGFFGINTLIPSNVLAGAVGSPMAIKFYDGPTVATSSKFGVISNLTITVPSPNWLVPPVPLSFGVEYSVAAFMGPRTSGGGEVFGPGFYTDTIIPEPSTIFLVGLGGVAAWFLRRRKS